MAAPSTANSRMRSPITYYGGKTLLARRIAAAFPEHEHYVEPYAGSLAVLLAKPPAAHETVNDLDGDLINFWRILRDRPDDLARVCALTPHSRAEHQAAYDPNDVSDLERARRVWVQLTQGRAGSRARTGWRYYINPAGSSASMPRYLAGYVARIRPAAERLARVSQESRPALEIIAAFGRQPDVLLYVDPPYLGTTRRSGGYLHDMKSEREHRELADALHACRATVVLSGYPSDLYDVDLYPTGTAPPSPPPPAKAAPGPTAPKSSGPTNPSPTTASRRHHSPRSRAGAQPKLLISLTAPSTTDPPTRAIPVAVPKDATRHVHRAR